MVESLFSDCQKTMLQAADKEAAGACEGVRPTSRYNKPPQKALRNKAFGRSSILKTFKMLGGFADGQWLSLHDKFLIML